MTLLSTDFHNAVSCNISKGEKFMDQPRDLDTLQNLMGSSLSHATPFQQVSGKSWLESFVQSSLKSMRQANRAENITSWEQVISANKKYNHVSLYVNMSSSKKKNLLFGIQFRFFLLVTALDQIRSVFSNPPLFQSDTSSVYQIGAISMVRYF